MKIRDILDVKGAHVHAIDGDRTVLDAVALLVEHRIGALLVRDAQGAVAGIVSERDILRACVHRSAELGRIRIADVMTRELVVCVPDDEVDYAMGIVTKNRVRHLPVMDGDRVAGMISIGDLVKAELDAVEYENRYLREYIQGR
jgi:CBS domain-containing protein